MCVENSVLLKCRRLRREDQEKSDSIVGFFLLRTQAVGSCSHRNLLLSNFTRLFYRHFWRRDFGGGDKFKQCMQLREALVCYRNFSWF